MSPITSHIAPGRPTKPDLRSIQAYVSSGAPHKRVAAPLLPKAAFRPMARNEHRLVPHGPQPLSDAGDQLPMVALREIRATYAAGEQHITHKGTLDLGRMKHHMARRMTRAVAHLEHMRPYLHSVAVLQPARGREAFSHRKTEHAALLRQAVDPELVTWVRSDDGQAQPARKLPGAACMVDVRMCEPDLFELQAQALDFGQQPVKVPTGINHSRLKAFVVPDERAILGKGCDGDSEVTQHG